MTAVGPRAERLESAVSPTTMTAVGPRAEKVALITAARALLKHDAKTLAAENSMAKTRSAEKVGAPSTPDQLHPYHQLRPNQQQPGQLITISLSTYKSQAL